MDDPYVPQAAARTRKLFDELAEVGPEFRGVIEAELAVDAPDFLPHVVMPGIVDCAVDLASRREAGADAEVRTLLGVLERWLTGLPQHDPVANVISVGFLESLAGFGRTRARGLVRDFPVLAAELRQWL